MHTKELLGQEIVAIVKMKCLSIWRYLGNERWAASNFLVCSNEKVQQDIVAAGVDGVVPSTVSRLFQCCCTCGFRVSERSFVAERRYLDKLLASIAIAEKTE